MPSMMMPCMGGQLFECWMLHRVILMFYESTDYRVHTTGFDLKILIYLTFKYPFTACCSYSLLGLFFKIVLPDCIEVRSLLMLTAQSTIYSGYYYYSLTYPKFYSSV